MSPSACGAGGAARLAVQAYLEGERLCDEGKTASTAAGIKLLRRAIDAEPDLDAEEWPAWADKLRSGLERAAMNPPPNAEADIDLNGASTVSLEQATHLASVFRERHFVIIDGLISSGLSEMASAEIARADNTGRLSISTVYASPANDAVSVAVPERRSDRIQYLDVAADATSGSKPQWQAVGLAVEQMDAVARCLKERLPDDLGEISARQRPMVSAYDAGCKFERHCDNHCHHHQHNGGGEEEDDEDGSDYDPEFGYCANRRKLSAVLYCVPNTWTADDGGALRIYKSVHETGGWEGDDALVDVVPKPCRLVLFASDQRVPHEVRPVAEGCVSTRYAIALWYITPPLTDAKPQPQEERVSETSVMAALLDAGAEVTRLSEDPIIPVCSVN